MMFKQVIAVRMDLKMGKGKIASQTAHASLSSSINVMKKKRSWFEIWNAQGQKKVVLKARNLKHLEDLRDKAMYLKLPWEMITDRGLTEVKPGTVTCMAIGPAPEDLVDKVTGDLPLL
jgi:PTH2 family peptidyl-tRNA hydrolase